MAGRLLARALEHAVQGIFVAWGYPVPAPKVQNYFDPVLAVYLQPADAELIRSVWEGVGHSYPPKQPDSG